MGVRGLTTYVQHNQDLFLKNYILHDSNLVIDGHSLCAQLYRSLSCFPAFGGDYDKFASYVRKFFKSLNKCNITSYVLFDGSYEIRKLKTSYSRLRSKIKGASRLDPVTQSSLSIFPILLRDVLKEVLKEMKISYTICEFEADEEIAALAWQLNCPILSYDSDFFIYNVLYIPFDTLDFQPECFEENGNSFYGLGCKIYEMQTFVNRFGGLKQELLPLFGTLMGNDYIQKRAFKKFFAQLKLPKGKNKNNELQKSIHGLLKWLQKESLDSAIAKIVGRMKNNSKRRVQFLIKKGMDGYSYKNCRSLTVFNINAKSAENTLPNIPDENIDNENNSAVDDFTSEDESNDEDNDNSSSDEDGDDEDAIEPDNTVHGLPEWFSDKIRQFNIPQIYIDLYTLQLYFTFPQAEDYTDEDSHLCALGILRYAFDIITDFSEDYFLFVSRVKDHEYKKIPIGKNYSISRPMEKRFSELSKEDLAVYLKHFLNCNFSRLDLFEIESLPSDFRLVILSILYWVSKCKVPKGYIHTLFLSYIMLNVIDRKTGTYRGHHFFNTKHAEKLKVLKIKPNPDIDKDTLFFNSNKVAYEDCLVAASVLLEHFELSKEIKKKPKTYDVKKVHKFAQFQCCLQQINCLNILCGHVYENTTYCKFYNGTFVYNLASKLEYQTDVNSFVHQYLKGAPTVLMFYNSLCKVYENCADQLNLVTDSSVRIVKRKKCGKKSSKININSFSADLFESEVII